MCLPGASPLKGKSEHSEQVTLVQRLRWLHPELTDLVAAVPNGGRRDPRTAAMLKAEGVLAGWPDLIVARPVPGYHGCYIEMKVTAGGRLSPDQKRVHKALVDQGYAVLIGYGADDAYAKLMQYLAKARTHNTDMGIRHGSTAH